MVYKVYGLRPSPCVQTEAALVHMEEEELRRTSSEWDLHTQSVAHTLQEEEIFRGTLCLEYNGTLKSSVCWTGSSEGRMENTCEVNDLTPSQITFMHAPNISDLWFKWITANIISLRVSHLTLVNVSAAFMHAFSDI